MVAATVGRAVSDDQKPKSNTSTWVYVLIAILVVLFSVGGAYFYLRNTNANK
jgi:hypothetical protein